jgi:DNA modification methylase
VRTPAAAADLGRGERVSFDRAAYVRFLRSKATVAATVGCDVDPAEISPLLKPHQRQIVEWAVSGGRRAIFAAFGLGKTMMQLETLRLTLARAGGRALIVCPLGVQQEFEHDAAMLGLSVRRIRTDEQADELPDGAIALCNYEPLRDGKLDPNAFTAVSLDEAAILRSFGSKTYQTFLTLFDGVPYRFVATATPSPNRYKELIHYAAFLGVMDSGQALTRFFKRDSEKAGNLTLLESQERNFWLWLASWSVWLQSPAELCGCSCHADGGSCEACECAAYRLPELTIREHEVEVDHAARELVERDGQSYLIADSAVSLQAAAREKRESIPQRIERLLALIAEMPENEQVIVYCHLNAEQRQIETAFTERQISCSSIDGSMSTEHVEAALTEWRSARTRVLLGKPVMLGVGLNLQQCSRMIFAGIDYRFHDTIQAVHRIHRFGQSRSCEVDLLFADSEQEILRTLMDKWRQHEELTETMSELIAEHGLARADLEDALTRSLGVDRVEVSGDGWSLVNNDCVPEVASIAEGSIDLIVTSIPFSNHYEYTPAYEDLGFTDGNAHFWEQMNFLTPELLRVLAPGRIYACHVKDRILFGNVTGAGIPTSSPFHAEAIFHAQRHGFDYLGMVTVVTDVVRENNQTYRLGWSEQCKDGSKMGVGSPEYVLLFHKPQSDRSKGYADTPIVKDKTDYSRARWQTDAHAFWRSSGDRHLTVDELGALAPDVLAKLYTEHSLQGVYDYESHVRIGEQLDERGKLPATFMALSPGSHDTEVWHDVSRMRTLNGEQAQKALTQHTCPLQFDIVDRLIRRYSNEDELVLDPFSGLGTVPLRAIRLGRRGIGVELNGGYFLDAVKYLEANEREHSMPTLFDAVEVAA